MIRILLLLRATMLRSRFKHPLEIYTHILSEIRNMAARAYMVWDMSEILQRTEYYAASLKTPVRPARPIRGIHLNSCRLLPG